MKEALLRYQRLLILIFHLLSLGLALFFLRREANIDAILELLVVVLVAQLLARFIGQTLSPLIRYYRSLGHFAVIHRLGAVSSLMVIDVVLIAIAMLWGINTLRSEELSVLLSLSYLGIMIIPSLTMVFQPFLLPDAKDEITMIALLRRFSVLVSLALLLLLLGSDLDVVVIAPMLAVVQFVLFILIVRVRIRYAKEITYRRQYEDSGHQESVFQLVKVLSLQALSLLPFVVLQGAAVMVLYLVPVVLTLVDQPISPVVFDSLVVIAVTTGGVRLLFHGITPSPLTLNEAETTNNQSRLRTELTTWLERGALLEVIVAVVISSFLGVILPIMIKIDYPVMILSIFVGYLLGISSYLTHMGRRLTLIASSIISVTALFFLIVGSLYYAVYFGFLGILVSASITLLYLYVMGYVWAFKEYEMEGKPHAIQLLKILGLFVLSTGIVAVLGFVLPPLLVTLAVGLRVLAVSSIVLLVEVVVMYAYIRVSGLSQYLLDADQIKQQFDTIYIALQEEETIW